VDQEPPSEGNRSIKTLKEIDEEYKEVLRNNERIESQRSFWHSLERTSPYVAFSSAAGSLSTFIAELNPAAIAFFIMAIVVSIFY